MDPTPSQSPLKETPLYWPWILASALVCMGLSVLVRRMRLHRPRDVAGMYRYLSKVLAFDEIRIREDPYRPLEKVAARYDAVTPEMTYEQALRLLYQDRYSENRLQKQQIRALDRYSREVAGAVYARQRLWRKCWMRLGRVLW